LTANLAVITGWPALHFDEAGGLQTGQQKAENGSATARALLTRALAGPAMLVFEDASNRPDVVFCRVVAGRWLAEAKDEPTVYVVLIDFEDFNHVMGDQAALESFNVGLTIRRSLQRLDEQQIKFCMTAYGLKRPAIN
jgi:hypothetical protein